MTHARKLVILVLITWSILLTLAYTELNRKTLDVYILDVGQGDAILIRSPQGKNILIDGGPGSTVLAELGDTLPFYDRRIDLLILTHPHADHLDGLVEVLKRYDVQAILSSSVAYDSATYVEFLNEIATQNISYLVADAQHDFQLEDGLKLDILFPFTKVSGLRFENVNNASVVAKLIYSDVEVLLTGDAEEELEALLIKSNLSLSADILKAGHHGSHTSTTEAYLAEVGPDLAIISSGVDNKYGHPHSETLEKFQEHDVEVLRTDEIGIIHLACTKETCEVE